MSAMQHLARLLFDTRQRPITELELERYSGIAFMRGYTPDQREEFEWFLRFYNAKKFGGRS